MRFIFPSLAAFVAFVAAQADPSINTPAAVVQCQPAQITFTATKTPVFISIIPGGQPSAAPLADLGQQNASPFTWRANIPAGTSITFQIRDSTGAVAYSAPVTIQDSSDSSCLGQSGSAPSGASSTPAGSSAPATSSPAETSVLPSSSVEVSTSSVVASISTAVSTATQPATTSRATASASSSSTRAASATSASASASSSPNAARSNVQVGFAGLLGVVAAVVMA